MKKIFFILFILTACQKAPIDFLVKEGSLITERRPLNKFDTLTVDDIFDINLTEDTNCYAEITAGENIMPYIKTVISSKNVRIENSIKGRWARPYHHPRIELHISNLTYIRLNEACNIVTTDSITSNNLFLLINSELASVDMSLKGTFFNYANLYTGSGHVTFRGRVNRADLFCGGTTSLNASELAIDTAILFQNSVADMHVWVKKEIVDLRIFKGGNLLIKGNPSKVHYNNAADSVFVTFIKD